MAKLQDNNLIDLYLQRATEPEGPAVTRFPDRRSAEPVMPPPQEELPRVFRGTIAAPGQQSGPSDLYQPKNRKFAKRKFSTFNLILILIAAAVAIVLYIGNVIRVGELMREVNTLQVAHQRNLNEQEMLRAQINRMASLDRIQSLAEQQLGLQSPKNPPVWMEVDREKIQEVDEGLQHMHAQRQRRK